MVLVPHQQTVLSLGQFTEGRLMADIEYNDFGFTAMDADELASVDTKIVEKTTTATEVIEKLDNFIRPLLENLAKDSDKDYIYWPNRLDILTKKLKELDTIQENIS
tara:strand:+ start:303 stop:620 length:318 start_codon:yes stop_codon:yes gene_type:complete